ncbi:MAG: VOC family protein [Hyphomicrobiaceae bacterium]
MSRLYGPIRQIGYVVRDIEAAMAHWSTVIDVGPWFYVDTFVFNTFSYRGRNYDGLDASVAMANSGDLQIELIQQRCQTPSMYRDFLNHAGEGLQHVAYWPDDYDAAYAEALKRGNVVGHEGQLPRGRFVYFESSGHPGSVFEFNEITPIRRQIIATIKHAAATWDGTDPVRRS